MARKLGQKTYSHLAELKQIPGPYEISTTKLLYHIERGFSVNVDTKEWYKKYLHNSSLQSKRWENFVDPRKTYYGRYVEQQTDKEIYVQKIFERIELDKACEAINKNILNLLTNTIPILRYLFHGLQMAAAYLGHISPSSRVLIPFLLQSADEMRRIQMMAYFMYLFKQNYPNFGDDAKAQWENNPSWQPARKLVEELLTTYDFAEAFVALNLVIKPQVDFIFMKTLKDEISEYGYNLFANILCSSEEDCVWHQSWSDELKKLLLSENEKNHEIIKNWQDKWFAPTNEAINALNKIFSQKN